MADLPVFDPVFHQTVRTRLAALLRFDSRSFSELKSALGLTDGNLDAHLRKLSSSGYLHSQMVFEGRPHTVYQLSESGIKAFDSYVANLEQLIDLAQIGLKK